ncbi:MAG: NAD(P)H:quinone oxidoreductase [Gammaproteobacteria bacterium]|nr:NAD(P)H:quinone oxidoreductase [Gammaproteobacteria bacterium]
MAQVLILYYSQHGSTQSLAEEIAQGVEQDDQHQAILRALPDVSSITEQTESKVPSSGAPFVTMDDFNDADGLIIGSPSYFGSMCAQMKYFLDQTSPAWLSGKMIGKPAGVFASSSSLHGGQESTLLGMMIPLLHHGMIISGIPYSEPALHRTTTGGSPYGATHVSSQNSNQLSKDEKNIAQHLGQRIATLSAQLKK